MNLLQFRLRFSTAPLCFASTGEEGGEGGTPGGGGGAPDWSAFTKSLEGLNLDSRISQKINDALGPRLDTLTNTVREASKPAPVEETPPDFDAMGNGDLAAYVESRISSQIEAAIQKALEPFASEIVGLKTGQVERDGKAAVADMQSKHKDFADFKDEMIALAQENPTLSIPRLYAIAKAENPTKAAELDAKYNPPPPKVRPFTLSSTSFGRAPDAASRPLSKADASLSAAREVASRHPGVLRALEDL